MANLITHERSDRYLQLSNGSTSALLTLLVIAGSAIAATDWERTATVWLAEHDQSVFGIGMVGFDLDELAFTREGFAAERDFLLRMVDAALAGEGWATLAWTPGDLNRDDLRQLRALIEGLTEPDAPKPWDFRVPVPEGWPRCARHQALLHGLGPPGCIVCNDA